MIVVGVGVTSGFVFSGWFPELKKSIPTLDFFYTPIICIVVGTYFIATCFFNVYSMAVDTIFLSFLQDLKQNDGTPEKPYFMEKGKLQLYIEGVKHWAALMTCNNTLNYPIISHQIYKRQ